MKFLIDESRIVGLVEDGLTPEVVINLGQAIGTYFGKGSVIATARDFRADSHMIKRTMSGGLMASGCEILNLHAAATATLQFVVRRFGCDAGISYTGAHYLDGEVSIRIIDSTGNELEKEALEKIAELANQKSFSKVRRDEIGGIEPIENANQVYKNAILSFIKKDIIKDARFRIVLDLSNGPSSDIIPTVFSESNVDVIIMNANKTSIVDQEVAKGLFPNPESIRRVSKAITAVKAHLGIIIDVEGVKSVFVDNNGRILPPEDSAAFLIFHNLKNRSGTIVLSQFFTQRFDQALKDIVGTKILRVADSPGNMGRTISAERAVIGATDNGKLYNPIWGGETDGTISALTMITILAKEKRPLSDLYSEFEHLRSKSEIISRMESNFIISNNLSQLDFFRKLRHHQNYKVRDSLIGIKIKFENGIGHFMTSMNEKEIKIVVETDNPSLIAKLMDQCIELASKIVSG